MGHSIGSSGKTYEKTPRQRNPQKGLVQWSKFKRTFPLLILHQLSISSHKVKNLNVVISIESKLSFLRGLSRYQENLIRVIEELKGDSWTYKDISEYLKSKGYRSSRGKELSPQLVERMHKKYLRKIEFKTHISKLELKYYTYL